jgi:hypothetical protein
MKHLTLLGLAALAVVAVATSALADTVGVPPSTTTTIVTLPIGDWVNQIVCRSSARCWRR